MSIVLNRGKILYVYISKTESELLAGIREMKEWVAEIENTSPAEADKPSIFNNSIIAGLGRGLVYLILSAMVGGIVYAFKRTPKPEDKTPTSQPPPL